MTEVNKPPVIVPASAGQEALVLDCSYVWDNPVASRRVAVVAWKIYDAGIPRGVGEIDGFERAEPILAGWSVGSDELLYILNPDGSCESPALAQTLRSVDEAIDVAREIFKERMRHEAAAEDDDDAPLGRVH